MEVVTLTYKSTNCYLVKCRSGFIMIDAGWPGTLPQMLGIIRQKDINPSDTKYLIVTHFHPDHGGLTQDLKDLGVKLILHESQVDFTDKLNTFFRKNPKSGFKEIETSDNLIISTPECRTFFKENGLEGEIIHTPGHSDDSVTIVFDSSCAFTGDLPHLSIMEEYGDKVLQNSWKMILEYGVKNVYPAHGEAYGV